MTERVESARRRIFFDRVYDVGVSDEVPTHVDPPAEGDDWVALCEGQLPSEAASAWVIQPNCGAIVTFSGTARDHSAGREEVQRLEYEAYVSQVLPRLQKLIDRAREQWPEIVRMALIHRVGEVPIGESAVVVAVSSPHRDVAFEAAKFGIDTLKATVPIWKSEEWAGGKSWGLEPQFITEA